MSGMLERHWAIWVMRRFAALQPALCFLRFCVLRGLLFFGDLCLGRRALLAVFALAGNERNARIAKRYKLEKNH